MRNFFIGLLAGVVIVSCVWGGVCFGISRGHDKIKEELKTFRESHVMLEDGNIELRRINTGLENSLREYEGRLAKRETRVTELEGVVKRLESAGGRANTTVEDLGDIIRELEQILEGY